MIRIGKLFSLVAAAAVASAACGSEADLGLADASTRQDKVAKQAHTLKETRVNAGTPASATQGISATFTNERGERFVAQLLADGDTVVVHKNGVHAYTLSWLPSQDGASGEIVLVRDDVERRATFAADDVGGRRAFLGEVAEHRLLVKAAIEKELSARSDGEPGPEAPLVYASASIGRQLRQLQCLYCAAHLWLPEGCIGNFELFFWCANPLNSVLLN